MTATSTTTNVEPLFAAVSHVKKGEDKWCAVDHGDRSFYGLFDGHGGAALAAALAQELPGKVLTKQEPSTEDFVEAFYGVDLELGACLPTEGSTATVAHVARRNAGARVRLAWVGDSQAICVDMVSKALVWRSSLHHVSNKAELERMRLQWRLRTEPNEVFRLAADSRPAFKGKSGRRESSDDDSSENNDDDFDDAATLRDMLSRAGEYEAALAAADARLGSLRRDQSFVGRRTDMDGRPVGPIVVQSLWLQPDRPPLRGASTCVTRTIGDWDSSRTLLPHPDVATIDVVHDGAWKRFILASDGLWDVVSCKRVAKLACAYASCKDAADALLVFARQKYLRTMDKTRASFTDPFRDDTTILVFDVRIGDPPDPKRTASFPGLAGLARSVSNSSSTPKSARKPNPKVQSAADLTATSRVSRTRLSFATRSGGGGGGENKADSDRSASTGGTRRTAKFFRSRPNSG